MTTKGPQLVSIHGGHSGQFCNHAQDSLEEIVRAYIAKGFAWVGITEHIPPVSDKFLYPEEIAAGLNAQALYERFCDYVPACRRLQKKYAAHIIILAGFETDAYIGYEAHARRLTQEFRPDYLVGSVHHVADLPFDLSLEHYRQAATAVGGMDALYGRYFDRQYEMINALKPQVVGHFDYIRRHDPDYPKRLRQPAIWAKILRNLRRIKELDLILDFNTRAFKAGQTEPYISRPILMEALALGIPIVPGDDSHGLDTVGLNVDKAIRILLESEGDTEWRMPFRIG